MKRIRIVGLCFVAVLATSAVATAPASATSYRVMAWGGSGLTNVGQLGNGTTINSDVPVGVSSLSEVTAISGGFRHSLALLSNGTVMAWGDNGSGRLGNGTTTNSDVPVMVSGLSEVTAVSGGFEHSVALLSNGTVKTWGGNVEGQLGNGTTTSSDLPVAVSGLTGVSAISAAGYHSLALLSNGTVKAWGSNQQGQLGNGTTTNSDVPVTVSGLSGVVAISAGFENSLALLSNGTVMAWGDNNLGQLGNGTTVDSDVPLAVSGLSEVTAISAGYWHNLALLRDGTVMAWGNNIRGQLGIGTATGPDTCESGYACSTKPVAVKGLSGVTAVSDSQDTEVLALLSNGTVMAWGLNEVGQLGNGTHTGPETCGTDKRSCSTRPVAVNGLVEVAGISAGGEFGLAMIQATSPPEYGRCVKVATGTGKYENAACTKEGGERKYEWYSGVAKRGFTIAGGPSTLETVGAGTKLACNSESGTGSYSGPKQVTSVVIKLTGCELLTFFRVKCSTAGAGEGEIVTNALKGALGIEKTSTEGAIKNKIAFDLSPIGEAKAFMEVTCGPVSLNVMGSVIAPITPVNRGVGNQFILNYKATKGSQKPEKFETGPKDVLEMSVLGRSFEQAGWTLDSTQTNEETVEINTIA